MRIGIDARVLYAPVLKGIGVYLDNLLMQLSKIDKKNEYILYYDSRQETIKRFPRIDNFIEKGIEIGKGDRFYLWEQIKLSFEVRKDKINVFHSPANTTMFFMSCPTIVTVHDTIAQEVAKDRIWDSLYFNTIQPAILRNANKIVAPSTYSKNRIASIMNVPSGNIMVIPNGIDESFRELKDKDILGVIKAKYKIEENYILNVGGESPWKNISSLIKAYAILMRKGSIQEQLVIAGIRKKDILQKHLKEIELLGIEKKVLILGYLPIGDLAYLYSGATIFVYPSLREGFGFPPLEAMASGVPVVASDSASIPEVVGSAAILVHAAKAENIAKGIETLLLDSDIRNNLIAAGFKRCKEFSWQKTAEETLRIYEEASRNN